VKTIIDIPHHQIIRILICRMYRSAAVWCYTVVSAIEVIHLKWPLNLLDGFSYISKRDAACICQIDVYECMDFPQILGIFDTLSRWPMIGWLEKWLIEAGIINQIIKLIAALIMNNDPYFRPKMNRLNRFYFCRNMH
jgi:hypothetical protein